MPNLYIITGPAGVGKTTISKSLAATLEKSALIEGDNIYNQIIGGHISPWKEGNHLNVFWDICLNMIDIYLSNGFDVVFNYIINPHDIEKIKSKFKQYPIKFIILISETNILIERDKKRPVDCQMGNRCLILLENFKQKYLNSKNFLDTTSLTVEEIVNLINNSNKYLI